MPRILIVDDETPVLGFLRSVFKGAGYDVHLASNADEAKAACDKERFDIVLSDVMMPGTNGRELV